MEPSTSITSVVKEVTIESCVNRRDEYIAAFFTEEERCPMRELPAQSVAGICAVKLALAALCRSLHTGGTFGEKAFTIIRKVNGAPAIGRFPDFTVDDRVYTKEMFSISISHTRTTAYGLAVVQERSGDHGSDRV